MVTTRTRNAEHVCGKRGSRGQPCRRPVTYPGAPCGTDHSTTDSTAKTLTLHWDENVHTIVHQSPLSEFIDRDWQSEARQWQSLADELRTKEPSHIMGSAPANIIQANLYEARAQICSNNGYATFKGLYTGSQANPMRVNARVCDVDSENPSQSTWVVYDMSDTKQAKRHIGHHASHGDVSDSRYWESTELTPAWARISEPDEQGELAIEIYRLDDGRPYQSRLVERALTRRGAPTSDVNDLHDS